MLGGLTIIPPMLGFYSPLMSMFYGALPEASPQSGSNEQAPQGPAHTVAQVGGHIFSIVLNKPIENIKVKLYGTDDLVNDIVYTDISGMFKSTVKFTTGQMIAITVNNTHYLGTFFLPYGVTAYYDFGTIALGI
jgi:hypothetical protein